MTGGWDARLQAESTDVAHKSQVEVPLFFFGSKKTSRNSRDETLPSYIAGGGFQTFFMFIPNLGEDEPILTCAYFSDGLVEPPTSFMA